MQEKCAVPVLRFMNTTDEWERRELREVATFNPKAELPDVFEYVDLESVVGIEMLSHRTETKDAAPSRAQRLAQTGDLFYQTVRPYQKNNYLFEKHDKHYVFSTGYAQMRPKIDGHFLLSIVQNDRFVKTVLDSCTGTSYPAINSTDLADIAAYIPRNQDEQKQIGALFFSLDDLIALHQRKYSQLCNFKSAMLEKMFPRDGADVPEIRFAGFSEAWKQHKLADFCEMFNGDRSAKYPSARDMVSEGIPFINAGDLIDGRVNLATANKITREKYDDLSGAKLQLGDIVYCLRGTLGKNAYIDNFSEGTVASSLVAIRPIDIDGRYLFHVLNSNIEYSQRIVHDEGAAQPNLSAKSVSEFMMPVPSVREQIMISSILDDLSNLVTLQQRKLERLKNIKKAFLEKMFV